tara:strand:+ start:711 stop:983 length:273 start_codon:yes stop_codon:yes gene_type:complete
LSGTGDQKKTPRIRDVFGTLVLVRDGSSGHFTSGLPKAVQRVYHATGKCVTLADGTLFFLCNGKNPESHKDLGSICMTCSVVGHRGVLHK